MTASGERRLHLASTVDYAISEQASVQLGLGYDRMFLNRANTIETNTVTLTQLTFPDGGGADHRSLRGTFGFEFAF